jgi:hypothetical protein
MQEKGRGRRKGDDLTPIQEAALLVRSRHGASAVAGASTFAGRERLL